MRTTDVTEQDYRRRFRDPAFCAELAEAIAGRHALPRPLTRKVEGSNLVFRTGGGDWLKISPPFFGDAFEAEVAATERVQGRLPLPVPALRLTGEIEGWRYLVSAHVPGVAIRDVLPPLSDAALGDVADELGAFMAAFHAAPSDGLGRGFQPWDRYLAGCLDDAEGLHAGRGNDAKLAARIARFLAPRRRMLEAMGPPVLLHADLTAEHVLLAEANGRWRACGVLDLADAMVAPAALDLITPMRELFRGRTDAQRRLIAAAGVPPLGDDPSGMLMAIALQHRFMHFHDWFRAELAAGMTDVGEIAAAAFPLSG